MRHVEDPHGVNSVVLLGGESAEEGEVRWAPGRSLWVGSMLAATVVLGPLTFSWSAFAVFLATTGLTLVAGHSVGFHRRLIHRSFACPRWVDMVMMWLGTLVGLRGPLWMMRTHDTRDWAQRQPRCHDYYASRAPWLKDAWWQMHCMLVLKRPPGFDPGEAGADPWLRFLDRTWLLQQLPVAAALFALGGWGWVVWGVCARVTASVTGHWFVGWLAHRQGPQTWLVEGAGVQAHDVPWAGVPTMAEAWHNNHHAYPGSAKMGLYPGQADWGWRFIQLLERLGLAWDIRTPETLPERESLRAA